MDNIVLIGMPGAGKSTVGVILAKVLGMDFVDTDLEIQRTSGRLLQEIIDEDGIAGFLGVEEQTVLRGSYHRAVIATGGSVVYSKKIMAHLMEISIVVYLKVGLSILQKRINNMATRGIAMHKSQTLNDIFAERTPLYEQYADITIECDGMDAEGVVASILAGLKGSGRESTYSPGKTDEASL